MTTAPPILLSISDLHTRFEVDEGRVDAVDGVTLEIRQGETLGLVGESGSGKSVTALSVMRLLPGAGHVDAGEVCFLGRDLLTLSRRQMGKVRGRDVAMVFQEPMTSLNPVHRAGAQVAEAILHHEEGVSREAARARTVDLFREVGIDRPEQRVRAWPHELSGGQKQRVMIAMALACNPRLLIADEPTTALDVTIQAQILDLLRDLRDRRGMALLFITHDLGVVAEIADHVAVMYRGKVVEYGDVLSIFERPEHPYTKGLLACRPRLDNPWRVLPTVDDFLVEREDEDPFEERELTEERTEELLKGGRPRLVRPEGEPLLSIRDLRVWFPQKQDLLGRVTEWLKAVDGVSMDIWPGQTMGLVGESGCGKTTVGRAINRLVEPREGQVVFDGHSVLDLPRGELRALRRHMQIVFQDPYSSLNPRLTVEAALVEPMGLHGIGTRRDRRDRAAALLDEVGLTADHLRRYPHEFSGGQRQRVCIARALSVQPRLLILDESVSALDVSVQARVLNLLVQLQLKRDLTYIFISHDLSVVKHMSDVMAVMRHGRIVEAGAAEAVYANPEQAYTRGLIEAIPKDDIESIRARVQARAAARA